ncbi:hypothetical protein RFI_28902, partial [Reticulomyxa filosa]
MLKEVEEPLGQALWLYDRYCNPVSAEQMLNLRGNTTQQLKKFWTNVERICSDKELSSTQKASKLPTPIELYKLFDNAETDVMQLLQGSWERFQDAVCKAAQLQNVNQSPSLSAARPSAGHLPAGDNLSLDQFALDDVKDVKERPQLSHPQNAVMLSLSLSLQQPQIQQHLQLQQQQDQDQQLQQLQLQQSQQSQQQQQQQQQVEPYHLRPSSSTSSLHVQDDNTKQSDPPNHSENPSLCIPLFISKCPLHHHSLQTINMYYKSRPYSN